MRRLAGVAALAAARFVRGADPGEGGRFFVEGLPPGDYHAAAIVREPGGGEEAWPDAAVLGALASRAATVTLAEGQVTRVSLPLISSQR